MIKKQETSTHTDNTKLLLTDWNLDLPERGVSAQSCRRTSQDEVKLTFLQRISSRSQRHQLWWSWNCPPGTVLRGRWLWFQPACGWRSATASSGSSCREEVRKETKQLVCHYGLKCSTDIIRKLFDLQNSGHMCKFADCRFTGTGTWNWSLFAQYTVNQSTDMIYKSKCEEDVCCILQKSRK